MQDMIAEIGAMVGSMTPEAREKFKELAAGLIILLGVMIDEANKRT